jgi:hypothetical protein
MDTVLLFMSASVVVGLIYFVFFRETRYVPSHNAAVKSVDLEPLVIRDFTKNELSAYNGRDGRLVYLAGTLCGQLLLVVFPSIQCCQDVLQPMALFST